MSTRPSSRRQQEDERAAAGLSRIVSRIASSIRSWARPLLRSLRKDDGRGNSRGNSRGKGWGVSYVVLLVGFLVLALMLALVLDSTGNFLYQQNEFVVCILFFALMLAGSEACYRLGRRAQARTTVSDISDAIKSHVHEIQTAILAVLGLLLAFTFTMAVSRYDNRKQALVEETNAIGTAYLRTQLLPLSQQTTERTLLYHYVDLRLASASARGYLNTALKQQTSAVQQQMWSAAVAAAAQDPRSISTGLYIQALNDVIDAQGTRDAARQNYVPGSVLYLLFAASFLALGIFGYRSGLGGGRSVLGVVMLVLLITLVVLIILDLDHPYQGLITISQQSLLDLRQSMGNSGNRSNGP